MRQQLGALLVQSGAITAQELDRALESQALFGGRLGTNLVDLGAMSLPELAAQLAQQHRLPLADEEPLHAPDPELLRQVPSELCRGYGIFPLYLDGPTLHLAMLDPRDPAALDELSFLLGHPIRPHVIPELRLLQLHERHLGLQRPARFLSLPAAGRSEETRTAQRRHQITAVTPLVDLVGPVAPVAPRSGAPRWTMHSAGDDSEEELLLEPPPQASEGSSVLVVVDDPQEASLPPAQPLAAAAPSGELTWEEGSPPGTVQLLDLSLVSSACAALQRAGSREAVEELLLSPFRAQHVLAVSFLVRDGLALAMGCSPAPAHPEELRGLVLPLGTPSLLQRALQQRRVMAARATDDPLQLLTARYLRHVDPEQACVLPVMAGQRVVNLLLVLCDRGLSLPADLEHQLGHLGDAAGAAYTRLVHQQRVTERRETAPEAVEAAEPQRPPLPDGRFKVTGWIGRAGDMAIWRAIDTLDNQVVNLHLCQADALSTQELQRLEHTVRRLQGEDQAAILRPRAWGHADDGRPFWVSDAPAGRSLSRWQQAHPRATPREAASLVQQVGRALGRAHQHDVSHGALSPDVIWLPDQSLQPLRVGGFARPPRLALALQASSGHPRLAAPETDQNQPAAPAGDVYALAALVLHLLGGQLPAMDEPALTPAELRPPLDASHQAAYDVLARGLARVPQRRPTMTQLCERLVRALADGR